MLGQRRRRWSTIKQTLGQRLVFAGLQICTRVTNAMHTPVHGVTWNDLN